MDCVIATEPRSCPGGADDPSVTAVAPTRRATPSPTSRLMAATPSTRGPRRSRLWPRHLGVCALLALGMLAPGCGEDERIHSYQAPKPPPEPTAQQANGPDAPRGPQQSPTRRGAGPAAGQTSAESRAVDWTVPDAWHRADGRQSSMRLATFHAHPGQSDAGPISIAVTALGPQASDVLFNVNRWRRQLGLGPLEQPPEPIEQFTSGSLDGRVFALGPGEQGGEAGGEPPMILVAMIRSPQRNWFVKIRDTKPRVESQRQPLTRFAKSFRLKTDEPEQGGANGEAAASGSPSPSPDQGIAPQGGAAAAGSPSSGGAGIWRVPGTWQQVDVERPALAGFKRTIEGQTVRIIVTRRRGEAGDLLTSVNRWREAVGQPPVDSLDQQPQRTLSRPTGGEAVIVTVTGKQAGRPHRIVAAASPRQQRAWIYKLTGPPEAVDQARDDFLAFVKSPVRSAGGAR